MIAPRDSRARALSLPNVLTLARIPLAGMLWLAPGHALYFFTLGLVAGVTDMLDGRVARALRARRLARGQSSGGLGEAEAVGAWLDPLCDKIFVLSAVASVYVGWRPPLVVLVLICTRELVLVPLMLLYELLGKPRQQRPLDFRAGRAGKLTTVAQFASVAAVILAPSAMWPLAVTACLAGLVTAAVYIGRGLDSLKAPACTDIDIAAGTGVERLRTSAPARGAARNYCDCGSARCKRSIAGAERRACGVEHCA
jgi:phosphatidylglycerophosphate synthase